MACSSCRLAGVARRLSVIAGDASLVPHTLPTQGRSAYHAASRSITTSSQQTVRTQRKQADPCLVKRPFQHTSKGATIQTFRRPYSQASGEKVTAFIALGSNVGDTVDNIEAACNAIDEDPDMKITDTSCLYVSKPMYVTDQPDFVNGACEIETTLDPMTLLDRLQAIEQKMGRVKTIDKGPRLIDLDIIAYGDEQVETQRLTIPHAAVQQRPFVLLPMSNMTRGRALRLPGTNRAIAVHCQRLARQVLVDMPTLTPLRPRGRNSFQKHFINKKSERRTRLMSILNVTPDSFSDGGQHYTGDEAALKASIEAHHAAGANLIDVGGQSTRPGATVVAPDEELSRVLPVISAAVDSEVATQVILSVDTFYADVARAAVEAGAHIVNDVSGGRQDAKMLSTVAQLGCTYVLMHSRGTLEDGWHDPDCGAYGPDSSIVQMVADDLSARVRAAIDAGIRRWRIILDPGIGFSKTKHANLCLLRDLDVLRQRPDLQGMPWLVGSSRKSFIGKIIGEENPSERVWGTAATVTAAIAGGANMIRVHDVREMRDVIKMSDAIYPDITEYVA